jgi:hypothetical protein
MRRIRSNSASAGERPKLAARTTAAMRAGLNRMYRVPVESLLAHTESLALRIVG